ncbi:hypothetical protein D3C72_1833990 [compost metagenome]
MAWMNMIVEMEGGFSAVAATVARICRSMRRAVALAALKRGESWSARWYSSDAEVYSCSRFATMGRCWTGISCERQ